MKRYLILCILLCIAAGCCFGQQAIINSLEREVSEKKLDEDKIIPLSNLALYYRPVNKSRALNIAEQAVNLSKRQKDNRYKVYAYASLSSVQSFMDSIRLCYNTMDTCRQYIKKTSDVEAKVFALNRIVVNKLTFDDRDEILDILDQTQGLLQGSNNNEMFAELYYNFYCYYSYSDIENTEKYARLSLISAIKSNSPRLISQSWNALGYYYQEMYEKVNHDPVYLDSAVYVLKKSLEIAEKQSGYITNVDRALSFINLSSAYQHKNKVNSIFSDSIVYYANKSLKLAEETGDLRIQTYSYIILSEVELANNRLHSAESLLLKALSVAEVYEDSNTRYTLHNYISMFYEQQNNYKKSLEYLKLAQENFMYLNNENYTKEGQLLAAKYEFEKKEQQLKFKQAQNNLYIGIAVFLLLGVIFLILFFMYRIKYFKQKEILLEHEKHEASLLAELKEAEAKRLQQEVVIGNMQLNYKNELLDNILKNSSIDKAKIERILNKELKIDNNFEDFKAELKEIHPDFYTKLQDKAKQKLTSLDFKYSVCIFMKMTSKDIAELLHVEPKTVRMTKYRLKQKLDLDKDQDLSTFIESII